ncbi:MAG: hypothetical protein HXY48_05935 [Ignavibacteriaceae bacterium]|nr:hypothetical protein [Ignavibacteriaceae bacterium]
MNISSTNKNSVIIVADKPIINPSEITTYENLSVNYSVFLNTLLFSNWVEILFENLSNFEVVTLLNEKDKEYLPKYLLPHDTVTIFYSEASLFDITEYLIKQVSSINSKNIILFYNSIGLNQNDILRIFNLIQTDEPSIAIGKSIKDKIVLTCTNGIDKDLINPLFTNNRKYSDYLKAISNKDFFIHTLEGFFSVDDFEDIKKLYIELSKKESLSYCSQKMHESFNDLFIEYKELLNV